MGLMNPGTNIWPWPSTPISNWIHLRLIMMTTRRSGIKASAKAQTLSFFHFRPETAPPMPALMQEGASLSPLVCLISKMIEPPPRAHDPPFVHSSIPRSPPV